MMADWFKSFFYPLHRNFWHRFFTGQVEPEGLCLDQNHSQKMHLFSMQPPENQRGQYKS
jgi:hypothetical protein